MIPYKYVQGLRKKLVLLTHDCCTPIYFATGLGGSSDEEDLLIGAEAIFRLYKSGLISSPRGSQYEQEPTHLQWREYIQLLKKTDAYDGDLSHHVIWSAWDLCATPLAYQVVKRFNLTLFEDVNSSEFEAYLRTLFIAAGVPWGDDPLNC